MISSLNYLQLLEHKKEVFKTAQNTRADVFLLEYEGELAVLKDYSHSNKGFSLLLAPYLIFREAKSLGKLDGVKGVPRLLKKVSSRAILMEYLSAERIREVQNTLNWPEFISNTEALIINLHQRGVVHGDLRNATNILVDDDQLPVFVDFVSAVHRGYRYNPFSYMLFTLCLKIDRSAIYKLKQKYAPELIEQNEEISNLKAGLLERVARWASVKIRNAIQRTFQ